MAILLSTDLNHDNEFNDFSVKSIVKDRLFFDQYHYSFRFVIDDLYCVRDFRRHSDLESAAESAAYRYHQHQTFRRSKFASVWDKPDHPDLANRKTQYLQNLAKFLKTHQDQIRLSISYNVGYLYTNNLSIIELMIATIPELAHASTVLKADVVVPAGYIRIQSSEYQFRSFFNHRKLSSEKKEQLANFLLNQQCLRLGPALKSWCLRSSDLPSQNHLPRYYFYTNDTERHYFIDHDDLGILIMLGLIESNIIRKTLNIISVNNRGESYGKDS